MDLLQILVDAVNECLYRAKSSQQPTTLVHHQSDAHLFYVHQVHIRNKCEDYGGGMTVVVCCFVLRVEGPISYQSLEVHQGTGAHLQHHTELHKVDIPQARAGQRGTDHCAPWSLSHQAAPEVGK